MVIFHLKNTKDIQVDNKSWLLVMSFDEHEDNPNTIKTLYHNKTEDEMIEMMDLLQDMNEHMILHLVEVDKDVTYENLKVEYGRPVLFMDSKYNWNNGKTFEDIQNDILEEKINQAIKTGDIGVT